MSRKYWLMKSEADCFSFDDLLEAPDQTTYWDGVRNFEVRNMLRDQIKVGDVVLFYHSNAKPPGIAGIAEVVKAGYPDFTAFDKDNKHFDPKSDPENPTWYMVDVRAVKKLPRFIGLPELRAQDELSEMALFRRNRLSITPVERFEFEVIKKMGSKPNQQP